MPSSLTSPRARALRALGLAALLVGGAACSSKPAARASATRRALSAPTIVNTPGTAIALTATRMSTPLRDGTPTPMWGLCPTGSCPATSTGLPGWTPGPTIHANAGDTLQIALTNALPVPTSLVILGQLGGGLGSPTMMASPAHTGQNDTTFVGNAPAPAPFVPPAQGPRVRSFGTEVPAGQATPTTLTWTNLKPGTYLYETGTLPSLEVPMGLYGVLVVADGGTCSVTTTQYCTTNAQCPGQGTAAAESCVTAAASTAYPGVTYDDQAALLFSEMDPVQNAQVDRAALNGTDVNLRWNDPSCSPNCYPAAVNYAPTYFFINGQSFDKTAPQASAYQVGSSAPYATGNLLVRLLNAGSRTHVPSIVGLPMAIVAEDGNPAPGKPKLQNEVLLTAGKTLDTLVRPPQSTAVTGAYAPNTYGVLDRALNLGTGGHPDGGMLGFLLVNHAAAQTAGACSGTTTACTSSADCGGAACVFSPVAGSPGNLPSAVVPLAVDDTYAVPCNAPFYGNVTANDTAVASAALVSANSAALGTLTFSSDGSFVYVPAACSGGTDSFTYSGNGGTTNTATVTLNLATARPPPVANDDVYTSTVGSTSGALAQFSVPRPGVLANDSDPTGYLLTASAATNVSCGAVTLTPDGAFSVTAGAGPSCQFTYRAINAQGTPSAAATVTVNFPAPSNLSVAVVDATTGAAIGDYRWTIQEDLTFQTPSTATTPVSTRTIATSFHRSHMGVVATGCVGPVSCGSGQSIRVDDGAILALSSTSTPASATAKTWTITASIANPPTPLPAQLTVQNVLPNAYDGNVAVTWSGNTFSYQVTVAATTAAPSLGTGASYLVNGTLGARHVVTDAEAQARQVTPDQVVLDPTKRYYLSILPGDGTPPVGPPGHAMSGGQIAWNGATSAWAPTKIKVQAEPLVPAQMSVYIYEDNNPTNGQDDINETPLGGFNIILFDPAGRTGDPAGQQTYDAFNMPLSNALLGQPGCPDELNAVTNGTATTTGNAVGVVYTCPNDPNAGTPQANPLKYALAGHALIKNLTPARYDVIAHPGAAREGAGEVWWQTETLEGTPAQDAFVGVNEPVYFQEFGPPGPHVTIGFVNPGHLAGNLLLATGGATVTGKVTNQHMSRPSNVQLWDSQTYAALSSTTCRVVLNGSGGNGQAIAAAECDPDGNFSISGVAPGTYSLAVFDEWLDQIIDSVAVNVPPATATVALGDVAELSWFTQYDQNIFMDLNGNGKYDAGEPGISNVPLTVRYRNGALSNVTLSDSTGNGILVELFPLFNWYVAEADTTRFKQTGVHILVDGGGQPDPTPGQDGFDGQTTGIWSSTYATGQSSARVEQPGALSYGLQGFISQRNRVDWGRATYAKGENGGIVGTVVYSSTRPFDDMRFNVQTIWEPLVPRVQVNLYQKTTLPDGSETLTLVDTTRTSSWDDYVNLVYGQPGVLASDGTNRWLLGSDNLLRDPATGALAPGAPGPTPTGAYPPGAQVNMSCPGQLPGTTAPPPWNLAQVDPFTSYTLGNDVGRCYDGWHSWNQVQAAPYDGRYVFPSPSYAAAHPLCSATVTTGCTPPAPGQTLVSLPPGTYVVEAVTPPGYEIVKEEDKNILIGDAFIAQTTQQFGPLASIFILPDQATLGNANPYNPGTGDPGFQSDPTTNLGTFSVSNEVTFPECVGALHRVPDYLSLFPQAQQVAPFAGMDRPLCDRKKVVLGDQMEASATFFVYTEVPTAANNTGIILDDATSEFNAIAPDFGEKASVPFVPISIKDFTGNEIGRTLSDQWGAYNMMTPSSWLVNPPTPSGYGPNMLITCINDPGPIPGPNGTMITDPNYKPAYSNFCYTNPYMPGQTTYLDTPVLPIAAFAAGYNPPDCAPADATPGVLRVDGSAGIGPWLPATGGSLAIQSQGVVTVPNPAYAGPFATSGLAAQPWITRNYGFTSTPGTVQLLPAPVNGVQGPALPVAVSSWTDGLITVNVPGTTPPGEYELVITSAAGKSTVDATTVTIGGAAPAIFVPQTYPTIQQAIDAASPGDTIMVDAGTYNELVIMYKPVRLQGVGAASVIVNAAKYPNNQLAGWRARINQLFAIDPITGNQGPAAQVDPLPTQEITGGVVLLEPSVLGSEEGAGITVLAKNLPASACGDTTVPGWDSNFLCAPARIDGVSVTGGDAGGGIYVNGWAHGLEISNDRIYGNAGAYHGGIRVGVPYLELDTLPTTTANGRIAGLGYDVGVRIHHNAITRNGTIEAPAGAGGAGGGVSICSGTDRYSLDHNLICGNYGASDGGGVGHLGFSQGGTIAYNQILFNQSFQQSNATHGGGIVVEGEPPIAGSVGLGTGDLTIDANLVRGNFAEGGQGGGIRLQQVNGQDVTLYGNQPSMWHRVDVTNNMVVNNVAGWAGGGLSLADTLNAHVVNDTLQSNDSTGIAGVILVGGVALPGATTGTPGAGYPSPSGLVSEPTSAALLSQMGSTLRPGYAVSNPELVNDILWHNRSFYYSGTGQLCVGNTVPVGTTCTTLPDQSSSGQCVAGAAYWDVGVLGDSSPAPGANHLNPTYSILTSTAGYTAPGNRASDPQVLNAYCNGARVVPELGTFIDPPSVLNLQVAATVDEGNNYVNLRYGPLYTVNPTTGASFGDYHLGGAIANAGAIVGSTSPAYNTGTSTDAPSHDFDAQPRPMGGAYDIGADEFQVTSPVLAVSPTALSFGPVSVNTYATLSVTVSNAATATANLVLNTPTIGAGTSGSSQPSKYTFTTTCPIGGSGLPPGASCTISVTFAPTAVTLPTTQTATLTVGAANVAAASVALAGTGVVPSYSITPGPLTGHGFGNQPIGTASQPFRFTVTNTGSTPVNGGQVWLNGSPLSTGTYAAQFVAAFRAGDTCTATTHLAVGASCTFSVVFQAAAPAGQKGTGPLAPGARENVAHVAGAVNAGLVGSPVWGWATTAATDSPSSLSFSATRGTTSLTQLVTVTNPSGNPGTPLSFAFNGTDATMFHRSTTNPGTCGASLAGGTSCTYGVVFAPPSTTTAGTKNASLAVTTSAVPSPPPVSLTGNAQ